MMEKVFQCPECNGQYWGTSNASSDNAVGHCHDQFGQRCTFSWPRTDDDKYFKPIEPLYTKEQVVKALPADKEIFQVACDESQQDWSRLEYFKIYKEAFTDGAKWMRNKIELLK
jgi:hypothetical protein